MTQLKKPKIEMWPIEKVLPHARNAKIHDQAQVNKLAESIKAFGWSAPIAVDKEGYIIAGHGRRLAALQLGLDKVPVLIRDDLTTEEADALRLSDNRVAMDGVLDTDMLNAELKRLSEMSLNFDLAVTGFDPHELSFLTVDLTKIDNSAFTANIMEDAAAGARQTSNDAKTVDEERVPVSRILGFKDVSLKESRRLNNLLLLIEGETGQKGVDALIAYANKLGA